jgi:hypothetical protein
MLSFKKRYRKKGGGTSLNGNSGGQVLQALQSVVLTPVGQQTLRFNGVFLPPKFINIMKYAEQWSVSTAGGSQAYAYKMNSVYDPYAGVGGHGCYGIDWFQSAYNRYRVLRSTFIVTADVASDKEATALYVYAHASSTTATVNLAEAAPGARMVYLAAERPQSLALTSTPNRWVSGATDRDLSAAPSADPSVLAYFHLLLQNSSAAALGVHLHVTMLFETEWSELKQADDIDD